MRFVAAADPTIVNDCAYSFIYPSDPFGGTLREYAGCGNLAVPSGSYLSVPLDSSYYPPSSFIIATYANPAKAAVNSVTVNTVRYITSDSISSPNVLFNGQSSTASVLFTSFIP